MIRRRYLDHWDRVDARKVGRVRLWIGEVMWWLLIRRQWRR